MLPSLQGRFKGLSSRRMWSRRPCGPDHIAAFKTAYIHRSQADPTSHNRRPPLTPEYPYPRICIGDLRECHASTQAHNDAQVQLVVVDLEEPRSLRATITWPGSEAMQHPAYQLPRIPLPRLSEKGRKSLRCCLMDDRNGTFRPILASPHHLNPRFEGCSHPFSDSLSTHSGE
jgi:hypothetical protein